MAQLTVKANRWAGGWELEISPEQHTQVRRFSEARAQVVDFLDTVDPTTDHSIWEIVIEPDMGQLSTELNDARNAMAQAKLAQETAATKIRTAVKALRSEGISTSDIALIMGVSRSRVSQLVRS
ncbi:DNA-binding CsgD family transcriptional regulator [Arcanobacterium wilhelmae]|uniref:DNA-binding CsgD family transcriptional regulator n=1 Tax=Arcanobacterium wilhelmae TaxID=1803177 RepID=A0ABT9NBP1_9ACTO|nr:antitoxin HicB [Arcanobacterium wilhelmae]MDP9801134.1 DNA-binding CsgD family transcriptional regulator [Arcanobacterium wilhelmae]WFN90487.1 antitoxin HicB [Arcanobacterium wilhelmae]